MKMTNEAQDVRIKEALAIARENGTTDGAHHKMWVIDQMCRALLGADYENWVAAFEQGEDGPQTHHWDTGTAP